MGSRKRRIFCIVPLLVLLLSGYLFADDAAGLQRNFILETHPVSWGLFGANVDAELNVGTPNSFVLQYQHFGTESPLNDDLDDDPEDPETFSGNNFIFGMRRYRDFEEQGLNSFYYGLALDYISVKYTCYAFYTGIGRIKVGTELEGLGPRLELGWRWIWPTNKITVRFGFFAGYLFLKKNQTGYPASVSDPEDDVDEDKNIDAGSAQMFAGIVRGVRAGIEFAVGLAF